MNDQEAPQESLPPRFTYDHSPALIIRDKYETLTPEQQIEFGIFSLISKVCHLQSIIERGTRSMRDLPEDALYAAGSVLHKAFNGLVALNKGDFVVLLEVRSKTLRKT